MQRTTDQNANGVINVNGAVVRKFSASRKFHESRKIEPTDIARMASRNVNGTAKHDMLNGKAKKVSTTSLDPSTFFEAATLLGSVGSLQAAETTERVRRGSTSHEEDVYKGSIFPFENLVFEGGGNKGMAYVGALQVLENAGIMKHIKRVAGASAGAIIATLIALGYDSRELREFLEQDLRRILVDHNCGYCSLLPNLLKGFGWNPGKRMLRWFGEQLKERTGDGDITFKEVWERFGKELCIVVTNLNQMSVEYFHPKTTPNTPIRRAVRMSVALPGVFQCVREMNNDYEDVYVDGGLLCNYPIHAFDGWWLSMDPKDTFFKKLQPLEDFAKLFEKSERFGSWNQKTLGIVLYSHTETELMKTLLTEREGNKPPKPPVTKLAKQRLKLQHQQAMMHQEHKTMVKAVGRFMAELQRNNLDEDSIINLKELRGVFKNPMEFSKDDAELLFGPDADYKAAFEELDTDDDGEKKDVERTIGIDSDYIETNDFNLESADKLFLIESGRRATKAFLREYTQRGEKEKEKQLRTASFAAMQQSRVTVNVRCASNSPDAQQKLVSRDRTDTSNSTQRSSVTSVTSLETSPVAEEPAVRRGSAFRLPPLSHDKGTSRTSPQMNDREGSEDSVTSARKVNVDVGRSPRPGGRIVTRVGDMPS
ncbi:hypothetical protein OS493_020613 [Desmophyllum pertusum]|uniref:PNPLA domain-containing protein n=1 Tax=Desmophyllum pertusum TaxID=174260 RepID=A0A9W9Z0P4_9CNID|nr:hypothetical protein OS493_020613 [Desmophyllum pertusum]